MAWPEWAVRAWEPIAPWAEKAAVWRGYEAQLQTLVIYAVGIALYAGIVFAFYQQMAKKDAWHSRPRPGFAGKALRFAESALVFPLMSFVYFALLAGALFLLAKSQDASGIFLISMSIVVGVRVVAFASEAAASDLAKLLPLGLLGVFLVDPAAMTWAMAWDRVKDVPQQVPLLARYFLLFLVMETSLKGARGVLRRLDARAKLRRATRPLRREQLVKEVEREAQQHEPARSVPVKGPAPREGPASHGEHFTEVE